MNDAKRYCFPPFDWSVLDPVSFKLLGELYVQSDVGVVVGGLPGVWEASQEMVRRNWPPFLRNRLLPKLVHSAIGLLGVSDTVPVDLEDLDARDGWILENRIDRKGGAEVALLLVELLLSSIFCSSHSHSFFHIVEITQESRS